MNRLRVGLVGCGDFGPEMGRYFRDGARSELVALCDPNADALAACAAKLGLDVPRFQDHEEMIEKADLDAVVITSPNFTHAPIAIAAMNAGKHVFCEKAMAATLEQCWDMADVAEEKRMCLMIGHKRRLRPPWAKMIEIAHSGELGAPLAVNITGFYWDPTNTGWWRSTEQSGGLLFRADVHCADWMRALLGNVAWVSATWPDHFIEGVDYPVTMAATFGFTAGAFGTMQASLAYPLWKFREAFGPQVVCERGGIRMFPYLDHIDIQWQKPWPSEPETIRFDDLGHDHAYRLETTSFADWVLDGKPPILTWREGLRCVEMMEAAHLSAARNGERIMLPLMPERERE